MRHQLLLLVAAFCIVQENARICENVDVRNNHKDMIQDLTGCTIITGYLQIVLLEYEPILDHHNISFPELKEISGFLLIFRVFGLTSIGKLFPNLTVIRGLKLFLHYSLVLYELPDLKEIGLTNLRYIGNGSARIGRCPHLCFVDTIDWSKIGSSERDMLLYFNANKGDCGFCPEHCNGLCWNENNCQITQAENCHPECLGCFGQGADHCRACKTFTDNGTCVPECPSNKLPHSSSYACIEKKECLAAKGVWLSSQRQCVVGRCPVGYEKNITTNTCYSCGEYCKKVCPGGIVDETHSAERYSGCTHIEGALRITGNTNFLATEIEDALAMVREIDDYLLIYRSSALKSLMFMKNLKSISGRKLYNKQYALLVFDNQNLRELWGSNFTLAIKNGKIGFHDNPLLCYTQIMNLVERSGTVTVHDVSPHSNGNHVACHNINLNINIINKTTTSATLTWNKHEGTGRESLLGYIVQYIEDPFGNTSVYDNKQNACDESGWKGKFTQENFTELADLHPYIQYAVYIIQFTIASDNERSAIYYFRTDSGYPSEPSDLKVISTTSSSITLAWVPPVIPGGVLMHYELISYIHEEDEQFIRERDYCSQTYEVLLNSLDEANSSENPNTPECCKAEVLEELIERRPKRPVRDVSSSNDKKKIYINPNSTTYNITSLQYFTMYAIILRVCNDQSLCSLSILLFHRTKPKKGADDIPQPISVKVENSSIYVKWKEPKDPNSAINSYIILLKRVDIQDDVPTLNCVTYSAYKTLDNGYLIEHLLPGQYSVQVTAVSLAGPGNPSNSTHFEIIAPLSFSSDFSLLYFFLALLMLLIVILVVWSRYRQKREWRRLIASSSNESLKEKDNYTFKKNDIDILCYIVEGDFGDLRNGLIKSQNRPCTVKFGLEYAVFMEFEKHLKDISSMKKFSDSYHIVNLLGIVPEEEPPLVIIELMAWGDLKSFFKISENAERITPADMYRMAAEIADGLIYLTSKNFIHYDLAVRNCMVTAGRTVKIVIFSISKNVYPIDYHNDETKGLIPVRWMAPESLKDGIFISASNVWSFGIILWEIVTFAEQPYQSLSNEEVIEYVANRNIMECPPECPELFYDMMVACWKWTPEERPLFTALLKQLQFYVQRDFKLISFYHSRDGLEYRKTVKRRDYNTQKSTESPEHEQERRSANEHETKDLPSSSSQV